MLVRFALLVVTLAVTGCHKRAEPEATRGPSSSEAPVRPVQRFGAAISPVFQSTPIRDVLSAPERYQGRPLLVEGYVRRACSRKGCWMELAGGADPTLEGCRVTFKDYGFFVPTDSAGSSARVEAALELASLSPATVEHMEREGAKIPNKAADGSAREVRLVANGVELWR
ncbi:MAG: DUF4920 domain-containing protein [Polyangiaceae bacterium]